MKAFVLALLFFAPVAHAADYPVTGMTCTYTKQSDTGRDIERTYRVQVVSHLDAARDAHGRPWLWVKRPGDERFRSFLATAADLTRCV